MDDAIGVAQEFQRTHPDTLIVVSADHSHTSQIIPVQPDPRGAYTTLQTVDGAADPHRLRHGAGRRLARPTPAPRSRSSPPARAPPTSSARSTRPSCSRSSPTPRPATARPPPTPVGGDVGGAVPATLALTVGAARHVRCLRAGRRAATTPPSLTANVISSAGDATLTIADASANATGHLVNGAFSLAQPLQARAEGRRVRRGRRRRRADPLLTYTGPVSNDAVPLEFKQSDRRQRGAAHGHVRQDAHADAVHHRAVARVAERPPAGPHAPAGAGERRLSWAVPVRTGALLAGRRRGRAAAGVRGGRRPPRCGRGTGRDRHAAQPRRAGGDLDLVALGR